MTTQQVQSEVYEGQFGAFTITADDRRGVIIYRAALMVAALCFAVGSGLVLLRGSTSWVVTFLTPLFACFWLALGVSLLTIHIYLKPLHQMLQVFWAIGGITALAIAVSGAEPLGLIVYQQPLTILGIGFTFAALTGLFFKEAVCFNRLETKILTPLVPILLLGHMVGQLPVAWEKAMLLVWGGLFLVFACRKAIQPIPPDIGDKSVFAYLKAQRSANP